MMPQFTRTELRAWGELEYHRAIALHTMQIWKARRDASGYVGDPLHSDDELRALQRLATAQRRWRRVLVRGAHWRSVIATARAIARLNAAWGYIQFNGRMRCIRDL